MNKDILKGILLTLGILSLFGIVFAVGFHTASEITSGTFTGDYRFQGNLILDNSATATCDATKEGALKYNNSIVQVCNGTAWNSLSASGSTGIGGIDSFTKLMLHFDNNFLDSSDSPYPTTPNGDPTATSTGIFSNAGYFEDDWIEIADSADWDFTGQFTIEMWIKTTDVSLSPSYYRRIFNTGTSGSKVIDLFLWTDGKVHFWSESTQKIVSDVVVNDNNWHHIALTRDDTNTIRLFIDGISQGTSYVDSGTFIAENTGLTIGAYSSRDANGDFKGYMDELRISSIARWTGPFTPPLQPYSN